MSDLVVDHAIYVVRDLDEAASRFLDHYGLVAVVGGRHAGHGTANRIIPLGTHYLELVAVVDPDEAKTSAYGRMVLGAPEGWIGHALRTNRLEEHLGEDDDILPMTRTRPDGTVLSWRLGHFDRFLDRNGPFVIEWDVPDHLLPGATDVMHRVSATGIVDLEMHGDVLGAVVVGVADGPDIVI